MKVMLKARKLSRAINVGTENEEDCAAMEAILKAMLLEHVESLEARTSPSTKTMTMAACGKLLLTEEWVARMCERQSREGSSGSSRRGGVRKCRGKPP